MVQVRVLSNGLMVVLRKLFLSVCQWFLQVYLLVVCSLCGVLYFFGIRNSFLLWVCRFSFIWLEIIDIGIDRISELMIGDSYYRKCGLSQVISRVQVIFSRVCMLCWWIVLFQGVVLLLCCGEFYCIDQLRKVVSMKWVWKSMCIGVSSIEKNIFRSMFRVIWIILLKFLVFLVQISIMLSSLGRNNRVRVVENNVMVFFGCYCGQIGNSCCGFRKYCGFISWCIVSSVVESIRKKNYNGVDRQDMILVRNIVWCIGCMFLIRNRWKFIRLLWYQWWLCLSLLSRFGGSFLQLLLRLQVIYMFQLVWCINVVLMKLWDRIVLVNEFLFGNGVRVQWLMKGCMWMIVLWFQQCDLLSCQKCRLVVNSGLQMWVVNCCMCVYRVFMLDVFGVVWMIFVLGLVFIRCISLVRQLLFIMLLVFIIIMQWQLLFQCWQKLLMLLFLCFI